MSKVNINGGRIQIGERACVSFQRTLRVPEDGQSYPLPPGLGPFVIHEIADYSDRVPPSWREQGGCFIAMHQREALWIGFDGTEWKPNAIKVAVGGVNAVSGTVWEDGLHDAPQDYIVCPDQPWLDGINAGDGFTKQFVAAPLGAGHTVEAQVTGEEKFGGIQLVVYEPRPGIFPDEPPPEPEQASSVYLESMPVESEMGIGAGGNIRQKIYPDEYGIGSWDQDNYERLFVHILNSRQYREVTGLELPDTPVSAQTYIESGLPWFDLYDESKADLPSSSVLKSVSTVGQRERGGENAEPSEAKFVEVEKLPVQRLGRPRGD
jgi:hypothetical protein